MRLKRRGEGLRGFDQPPPVCVPVEEHTPGAHVAGCDENQTGFLDVLGLGEAGFAHMHLSFESWVRQYMLSPSVNASSA